MFPREGGGPVWTPAFAGEQASWEGALGGPGPNRITSQEPNAPPPTNHPGEGRGPVGRTPEMEPNGHPNWAPASAGVA